MNMLEIDSVVDIHDNIIKEYGGLEGIKDYGQLESSLNNAFASYGGIDLYQTDIDKISNIFYLLVKNHCFTDANKRTAITVFNILIAINDINIKVKVQELEDLALDASESRISMEEVTNWIKEHEI